jgi:hypothetical protein
VPVSSFVARCNRVARILVSPGNPSFLIIGAQKAGTTSLHRILREHSQIEAARVKEVNFFNNDRQYRWRNFYPYARNFPTRDRINREYQFFEATPQYLYHPKVAERIHAFDPQMKLIVLLREPASRALSAWTMYHHHYGDEINPHLRDLRCFADSVRAGVTQIEHADAVTDYRGYIARGLYAQQLIRYFRVFDRKQILVLENEQLMETHDEVVTRVLDFLELPRESLPAFRDHQSLVKPKSSEVEELTGLRMFFKPHNEALFKLLDRDFGWNEQF